MKAELEGLRLEKEALAAQLTEYQGLCELNKKFCASFDLPAIFRVASGHVTDSLGYERVLFLQQSGEGGHYTVCALDGYQGAEKLAISGLTISKQDPLLVPLLAGEQYRICADGCGTPELLEYREKMRMDEYLLFLLGAQGRPLALLAFGNSRANARSHRRVSESEAGLPGIGNLVGLLSSTMESRLLRSNVIMQDITEHKKTEETLLKLSQAVEQSPVTIVITDTAGSIQFVNPKFVQLTGYSVEEALGKSPGLLKSEVTPHETHQKLWETIRAGKVWEGEFVNRKKDGELFSERATISPIKNKEGVITHYLAIKEDITERKQLEAQLLQSQKMESVGRLAGGVAHDFNNMLSVIIGCAQLAMLKVSEGDKVWQYLSQISKAAERSSEVTRQLLAFSRKEIVTLKKLNLNDKMIDTQTTLGRLIGEDISLTFKPAPDLWTIEVDPSQLDQILVNLAVNARDAMPEGGHLAIETANVHIGRNYCHFHLDSRPGDYVQITVSDSGCGMDKKTLGQIFEPFFTTKEVGKGTGLGLSTVYGIIRQNHGFINVYSEPGHGTSFQLHFPRYLGEAEPTVAPPETELSGAGNVLLVEDDPLVREMALQMLGEMGYTVTQARTAQDAIEICKRGDVPIDVVLTDVVMPGMNGKEMVQQIELFRPSIKVLFMSGYTSELVAQRGVVDEGRHFIQKPFDMHSLNEKIKNTLLDEQRSYS